MTHASLKSSWQLQIQQGNIQNDLDGVITHTKGLGKEQNSLRWHRPSTMCTEINGYFETVHSVAV